MLSLQMKSGDYLTIGDNVVVQVFQGTGSQIRVSIQAPKEISILRGEVREQQGRQRPEGLLAHPPKPSPAAQARATRQREALTQRRTVRRQAARERTDAVAQMRAILTDQPARAALSAQLDRLNQAERAADLEAMG